MPTLNWIGKEAVINHHHDVPFKTLDQKYTFVNGETIVDDCRDAKSCVNDGKDAVHTLNNGRDAKSCVNDGKDAKSCVSTENKIIHGDNLEALKALLPEYEGRIKCIYIDPPYNTGNENWVYNDNVNSPRIRKWLGQVVGKEAEDLTRHDKWLCMMYPRLKLLHQLLADDGAIFISIDDNEQANLKLICDEIFGSGNFVAQVIWHKNYASSNDSKNFSTVLDYILTYRKSDKFIRNLMPRTEKQNVLYKYDSNDGKGKWRPDNLSVKTYSANYDYPIKNPNTGIYYNPPQGRSWMTNKEKVEEWIMEGRVFFGQKGDGAPQLKRYLNEVQQGVVPITYWSYEDCGHNDEARKEIKSIFEKTLFDTPKPTRLLDRILKIATDKSAIILDSFAGSGTTAHAVLNLNKQDGGNRKFILVEMEDYAETITAERVRRVINGYGRRDAKSCVSTEGTGGSFTYYELGEPIMNGDYLNENQPIEKIREYIWYTETCVPYCRRDAKFCVSTGTGTGKSDTHIPMGNPYHLGNHNNAGYYFYYEKNTTTTLDKAFLNTISEPADQYIIYADNCLLSDDFMRLNNIVFKKIPRDIRKF